MEHLFHICHYQLKQPAFPSLCKYLIGSSRGDHADSPKRFSFSSLVREISKSRPSESKTRSKRSGIDILDYPASKIFRRWVEELRARFSPLPPDTTAAYFRLLFPEEDVQRKYGIQETRMARLLADCFGIDHKAFDSWSLEEATGCLGQEMKVVLERSCSVIKNLPALWMSNQL